MNPNSQERYRIIDILKGVCILWVIMLHAIPAAWGGMHKLLLMPFYAQQTIPFFMTISGFTYAMSYERNKNWYTVPKLWRNVKRFIFPYIPLLILEGILLGKPDNILTWLLSGGYMMPGSYYVILLIQLVAFFPFVYALYNRLHVKNKFSWVFGIIAVLGLQCLYELLTYLIDLDGWIYRLLIFRYVIFLYVGIALYKTKNEIHTYRKSIIKLLPVGFIYIFLVGYMNWQPSILFRYPTWYRTATPVVFWVAPISAYIIGNGDKMINRLGHYKLWRFISGKVQLIGQSSYHIYIVQMLWFGLIVSRMNTDSWRKLIVCIMSMLICSALGIICYHSNQWISRIFNTISQKD